MAGLRCCGTTEPRDLEAAIIPDGESGLLWRWSCGACGRHIRVEPFSYPPDFPID